MKPLISVTETQRAYLRGQLLFIIQWCERQQITDINNFTAVQFISLLSAAKEAGYYVSTINTFLH